MTMFRTWSARAAHLALGAGPLLGSGAGQLTHPVLWSSPKLTTITERLADGPKA
jgi:hypothetical protein